MKNRQNPSQKGSFRLYGYDYSADGYYFVTICTKDRIHHFGQIQNGEMFPSQAGTVVTEEWLKTPGIRANMKIELDNFCLMPNHFHAIIKIGDPNLSSYDKRLPESEFKANKFGTQSNNLPSIMRGFKGAYTIQQKFPPFSLSINYY